MHACDRAWRAWGQVTFDRRQAHLPELGAGWIVSPGMCGDGLQTTGECISSCASITRTSPTSTGPCQAYCSVVGMSAKRREPSRTAFVPSATDSAADAIGLALTAFKRRQENLADVGARAHRAAALVIAQVGALRMRMKSPDPADVLPCVLLAQNASEEAAATIQASAKAMAFSYQEH